MAQPLEPPPARAVRASGPADRKRRRLGTRRRLGALLAVLALGCSVTLISEYDEHLDRSASELQRWMDAFLTSLDLDPQPTFEEVEDFYIEYEIELRSLLVRARSHPHNERTVEQLELMIANLRELRTLHQAGPLDGDTLAVTRNLFNQAWGAVIALELAKKRGERRR